MGCPCSRSSFGGRLLGVINITSISSDYVHGGPLTRCGDAGVEALSVLA